MPLPVRVRIQEWFADRFRWAQYPKVVYDRPRRARGTPWEFRIVFGIIGLGLCAFALAGAVVLFVFLRAAVLYG